MNVCFPLLKKKISTFILSLSVHIQETVLFGWIVKNCLLSPDYAAISSCGRRGHYKSDSNIGRPVEFWTVYDQCSWKSESLIWCVTNVLWFLLLFLGAAAAAVMSSSKVTTVLRPASAQMPSAAGAQSAAQHIIHPPIQVRYVEVYWKLSFKLPPFTFRAHSHWAKA